MENFTHGMAFPDMKQSFHYAAHPELAKNRSYLVTVEYINTLFTGAGDLDGISLYQYRSPVEMITDTDNNGQINGSDVSLAQTAYKAGASSAETDKATEFIFANDLLSNGAWDELSQTGLPQH